MFRWVVLVMLGACGFQITAGTNLDGSVVDGDATLGSDGDSDAALVDAPIDGAVPGGWSTPQSLGITDATEPTLTADLLEIWFARNNDIYHATRASTSVAFGPATMVMELSTASTESSPEVSIDGSEITFTRFVGNNDVWISRFDSMLGSWGDPTPFNDINTGDHEASGNFSQDNRTLAFVRQGVGSKDIFFSTRSSIQDMWPNPVAEIELNSTANDSGVFLGADNLTACFDSNRGGQPDIYCATRVSPTVPFSIPLSIAEVNSPQTDRDPWLSPSGRVMVFWSDRDGTGRLYYSTHP